MQSFHKNLSFDWVLIIWFDQPDIKKISIEGGKNMKRLSRLLTVLLSIMIIVSMLAACQNTN